MVYVQTCARIGLFLVRDEVLACGIVTFAIVAFALWR
jgi:hypothetical protein